MERIALPVSEETIRELRAGDEVLVSGLMVTARDTAHRYLIETDDIETRTLLKDAMIYHCGPVVARDGGGFRFVAAGPTTSDREEPYEAGVIARYGVRGIIGKGGMGARTLEALKSCGAVYLHATGGIAVLLARCVTAVKGVIKLEEFGVPEAIWIIEVKDFPAVVTMDSHGCSLHAGVLETSQERLQELLSTP
ncbi:MAG: FumA C-terminus/TtdB family hydratase beta subunit [Myxococcota bacterium]|jgi:fumarate hydratase class I